MAIKLEMLRTFVMVAKHGNLTAAASELGRTPSAVSMTLKQLQEHLGKPLFESDRKNTLSALGAYVFELAGQEIKSFDNAVAEIEAQARTDVSVIRIASVPSFAAAIMPGVLKSFLDAFPDVRIDLRDMSSASVLGAMRRGEIDIGIATAPDTSAVAMREALFSDVFGVVCASNHRLASLRPPVTWADLRNVTLIRNGLAQDIGGADYQELLADAKLNVPNTTSLLALVRDGVGVTLLPKLAVALGGDGTTFVPLADQTAERRIDLLRQVPEGQSKAMDAFCKIVKLRCENHQRH